MKEPLTLASRSSLHLLPDGVDAHDDVTALLLATIVLLCVLLVAALTVMRSGFVALTSDRVTLLVNETGETQPELVRWAPPNQAAHEENLITHHVIFLGPDGRRLGEVWMYGDEVAVKGRVLRLSPFLKHVSDLQHVGDLNLTSREAEFTGKGGCDNMRPRRCIATQS